MRIQWVLGKNRLKSLKSVNLFAGITSSFCHGPSASLRIVMLGSSIQPRMTYLTVRSVEGVRVLTKSSRPSTAIVPVVISRSVLRYAAAFLPYTRKVGKSKPGFRLGHDDVAVDVQCQWALR